MSPTGFFILSFIATLAIVKLSGRASDYLTSAGVRLQTSAFPSHSDVEYLKFSLLRIPFGLLLLDRCVDIHMLLVGGESQSPPVALISLVYLIATLMLTLGLMTQYVIIFLVFFMWQSGDRILGTDTLGNDVAAMLAVMLFLSGAGKYLSIDAKIIQRFPGLGGWLLYSPGNVSPESIALIKFGALVAYWAVCLYSLSVHLGEPAWTSGTAGPLLLTNNFMSSWHGLFAALFHSSEWAVHLARYSIWAMMLWYPAIVPFVLLGGFWRTYIIVWGLLFFTLSSVVLNLGSLAEIEFILWAALFWSKTGLNNRDTIKVFYDDRCNLCDKTVRSLCFLDLFSRIELKPVSKNHDALRTLGIDPDDALKDLYGVCDADETVKFGYDFYLLLSKKIVLLWPVFPLLWVGRILGVGNAIYRRIALKRVELFGVCTPSSILHRHRKTTDFKHDGLLQKTVVAHIVVLSIIAIACTPAPYIGVQGYHNAASQAAHYYGVAPINVFNETDLRMAENWFTLESIEYDEIVPVLNEKGERLDFHRSDRIYFGGTLKFRRGVIHSDSCEAKRYQGMLIYFGEVYLNSKNSSEGKYHFRYRQYHQKNPYDQDLLAGVYNQHDVEIRCEANLRFDYKT